MYVDELVNDGYVVLPDALDPDFCETTIRRRFDERGWDDPSTWPVGPVHLPATEASPLRSIAPIAADALVHLVGGTNACRFSDIPDNLIVNFPDPHAAPVAPQERATDPSGWHKDGDWFRHFLDSPEQGLLGIVLWRDVTIDMGPTLVASDSLRPMAELLARATDGFDPPDMLQQVPEILASCGDIRPIVGTQGTVILAHPFLLHTASVNTSSTPRIISNTSVMLRAPMRFDAPIEDRTDVERATLALLGRDHLDFAPTGSRDRIVSERERRWADGLETGRGARSK